MPTYIIIKYSFLTSSDPRWQHQSSFHKQKFHVYLLVKSMQQLIMFRAIVSKQTRQIHSIQLFIFKIKTVVYYLSATNNG